MNIEELFDLTTWIEREIEARKIVKSYQDLHAIINHNVQANQEKQPFESQKHSLISILRSVDLAFLTTHQLAFLRKLNIAQHVGNEGVNALEDLLYRNVIDMVTSASMIGTIIQEISRGIEKKNQIKSGLDGCIDIEEKESGFALIRISFEREAHLSNIVDFKRWGAEWHDIGRGIAMAHNIAPEDIRITGATKGSIVLELAVIYAVAKTVGAVIVKALEVAERVIGIRLKAEELRALQLTNDKIASDIEDAAEGEKTTGINRITQEVTVQLGIAISGDGERVEAFDRSIRKLVDFIEKGGEVDCVVPQEEPVDQAGESAEPLQELRDLSAIKKQFETIRALENRLRALEHKEP